MREVCGLILIILVVFGCAINAYTASDVSLKNTTIVENKKDVAEVQDDILSGSAIYDNEDINSKLFLNELSIMQKAELNDITYGWKNQECATKPPFKDGVLCSKISDFDNDGDLELLVLKLESSEGSGNPLTYAVVKIEIYEVRNGRVELSAKTDSLTLIDSFTDAGGLECFKKNNYIVLECAKQNNTFADGANQDIEIYSYDGNNLTKELGFAISGSSVDFTDNETIKKLKDLDFTKISDLLNNEMISPYFVMYDYQSNEWNFKDCTNLAKIEDDVELLYEVLITNNTDNLLLENSNVVDWSNLFVDKGVMSIKTYNYCDRE